eukprot:SAG11_NODE_2713_length_3052_cov_7.309854_4_plen_22_part_01
MGPKLLPFLQYLALGSHLTPIS